MLLLLFSRSRIVALLSKRYKALINITIVYEQNEWVGAIQPTRVTNMNVKKSNTASMPHINRNFRFEFTYCAPLVNIFC